VSGRLPAARSRTFYAVADALGAGDRDLAPALAAWLSAASPRDARALLRFLALLEQLPRATRAGHRGFAWLPRALRARWLDAVSRAPLPGAARHVATLRGIVREGLQSPPGP